QQHLLFDSIDQSRLSVCQIDRGRVKHMGSFARPRCYWAQYIHQGYSRFGLASHRQSFGDYGRHPWRNDNKPNLLPLAQGRIAREELSTASSFPRPAASITRQVRIRVLAFRSALSQDYDHSLHSISALLDDRNDP